MLPGRTACCNSNGEAVALCSERKTVDISDEIDGKDGEISEMEEGGSY